MIWKIYISHGWTLPFLIINTFDDPNDQSETFKNLVLSALNENSSKKGEVKMTNSFFDERPNRRSMGEI